MTQLNLEKHQSLSKIGTVAGAITGMFLGGGNRLVTDVFAITGTVVGSFISKPVNSQDITSSKAQLSILKNHFDGGIIDNLNPLETNYNLYERDNIGNLLQSFEQYLGRNKPFHLTEQSNKIISTKYIVFDIFNDTNPEEIILDLIPFITICAANRLCGKNAFESIVDVGLIYCAKPAINYMFYRQGNLHDYEEIVFKFGRSEIDSFKDCLPQELYLEIDRVSL